MTIDKNKVADVASPCMRNCCLNNDDICLGCFRHIDEILAWKSYVNKEKQSVISTCQQRRVLAESKLSQGS